MTVDKKRYTLLKGSSLQIRQQYHCRHRSDCFILFFKLCTLTRVDLDFFFLITEATSAVPHSFTFFPSNICFWKHFQGQICGFSTQTNTFLGQRRRKKKNHTKSSPVKQLAWKKQNQDKVTAFLSLWSWNALHVKLHNMYCMAKRNDSLHRK